MEPQYTRLQALKEALNSSPKSSNTSKFPWQYLCILYLNAHSRDVYIENFKGLKLLYNWLGPFTDPNSEPMPDVSSHLLSYESQKLASLLNCNYRYIVDLIIREYANGNLPNH